MNDLRILTGEKKGASITLSEGLLKIGSGFDSALMLLAEEIGDTTLSILVNTQQRYSIHSISGNVLWWNGIVVNEGDLIEIGQKVKIGTTWISIAESSTPWDEMPPTIEYEKQVINTEEKEEKEEKEIKQKASQEYSKNLNNTKTIRKGIFGSITLNLLMIVLLSVFIVNYAYSSKKSKSDNDLNNLRLEQLAKKRVERDRIVQKRFELDLLKKEAQDKFESNMLVVKNMLHEREIINVVLSGDMNEFVFEGKVSRRESETLERMIKRVELTLPEIVLVNNTVLIENSLPFNIISVSYGPNSMLMLETHGVVSIGQTVVGYRLDSITESKIYFSGEQQLEINW